MPRNFPRAPLPFLAALVSPFAWQFGRPDLFDTYSIGVLLLQMAGKSFWRPKQLGTLYQAHDRVVHVHNTLPSQWATWKLE